MDFIKFVDIDYLPSHILKATSDTIKSDYPRIGPKRTFKDPEYFNRSVELVNDTVKRYFMEDAMKVNEMFCKSLVPNPTKIIYNPPATIVFWADGTNTVVKCCEEDEYSEYYGFLCALGKKIFGANSHLKKMIDEKAERHYPENEFANRIEALQKAMNEITKQFGFEFEE